ncbi:ATP-binding protein [Agromyces intestinalis]|uniref:ATP-binding protein n=1 Tax=Agromyces intestinalis TaxID=2592652 RepID=A0A5C1YJL1_9MICO|nr:ATP-binding protein [Agromyces intestinalis]QEO15778.1 ATP-binding protein [Agromyces intestinalis]
MSGRGAGHATASGRPAGIEVRSAVERAVRDADASVIAIDGPSGVGKSSLATALAAAWPAPTRVLRLDDIYPGWHGLDRGARAAKVGVFDPLAAGRVGHRPVWDWTTSRSGGSVAERPRRGRTIVEGCGAFAAVAGRRDGVVRIWLEAPDDVRRDRALRRDAGGFDPYWPMWDAQWRRYAARRPRAAADLIVRIVGE